MTQKKKKEFNKEAFNKVVKELHNNSISSTEELYKKFSSSPNGLTETQAKTNIEKFGRNETKDEKKPHIIVQFLKSFANSFVFVLIIIGIITYITSCSPIFVPPGQQSWSQLWIIIILIITSGSITFIQEYKSEKAADSLKSLIKTTCFVKREDKFKKIDMKALSKGDLVRLTTGDIIPADIKIISCKDLFVSQSALTGESEPVEKHTINKSHSSEVGEYTNLCLLGTNVVSGNALGIVIGTGASTYFGAMQSSLNEAEEKTSFEKSVDNVSKMLLIFMFIMVPLVLIIDWYQTRNFLNSLLFAASVAVGLTPIMLPTIVSENLAKGALMMSKKKTVVKKLSAIQNFGSMEILCTDKTGTLTDDKIVVEKYINISGKIDDRVLKYGYLNSFFQSGLQNVIDHAIIEKGREKNLKHLEEEFERIDDIAFDFNRRRMSVIVRDEDDNNYTQLITKGALEEMLIVSKYAEVNGRIIEITKQLEEEIRHQVKNLNSQGMRVIGVAKKDKQSLNKHFSVEDENHMTLLGFIAFLDPPKESSEAALQALNHYGVDVKVLTGDNDIVTKKVCEQVGLKITNIVLGPEIEPLTDDELFKVVMQTNVFAKLNPLQKARIVRVLKNGDKIVGFMGDGINDSIALKEADVGISVDTAVDIAKESASVILLEKDLMVLKDGIIEGRKIFANTTKYLKITASSNYGNSISVLLASIFIPFVPMLPIELLIQNLVYDITQVIIPWDNVDKELILKPRKWDAKDIGKFMVIFGPTNSIFDICTFLVMWFLYNATGSTATSVNLFQTGWFMEGFITQVLVLYMLRTEKLPFIQSNPSWQLNLSIILSLFVGLALPYTAMGKDIGMVYIDPKYFIFLILVIVFYFILSQLAKVIYLKRFKQLL